MSELADILSIVSRADRFYCERARPGAVKESLALLAGEPGSGEPGRAESYDIQWRLARALFFSGESAAQASNSHAFYGAGVAAGERAARLKPDRVEGRFWLGVNLALLAQESRGIAAARAVIRARFHLKGALAICESYHAAGPLRVLARLDHKAPRFLGGSKKRSRATYDRALALAPSNSVTLLYAAELALDTGDVERATALLGRVIQLPIDPDWHYENMRDRDRANMLLGRLHAALSYG